MHAGQDPLMLLSMNYDLYVITDEVVGGGRSHTEIAQLAVAGGVDIIQLRDKVRGGRALLETAQAIRTITREAGAVFIVNDRLDVALACGADGVHLGQDDLPARAARQLSPSAFIIGVSVGTAEEAIQAVADGADYVAVGPVFSTASKDDAGQPVGLEMIKRIRQEISLPLVAIGGIDRDAILEVIGAGADGVAVISAVVGRPDITGAAREIRREITRAKEVRGS